MNEAEAFTCAVCGDVRPSMRSRARHERFAHPTWTPSPSLRRARTAYKNATWKKSQGPSYAWMDHANQTAAAYGLPPLPIRTSLPVGPCVYCGGDAEGWDHVIPFARGGTHTLDNLTPACLPCNQRKNAGSADILAVPKVMTLLCGWCWKPVQRRTTAVRRAQFVACSLKCLGNLGRNPLPFGRPWRPGRHEVSA